MVEENQGPLAFRDLALANGLLAAISGIGKVISRGGGTYRAKLLRILELILDYLGAEQGSIMIVERRQLVVRAATRSGIVGFKQPLSDLGCVGSFVATHGRPLFIPDITKDPRFHKRSGSNYKKQSLLSVPIMEGKKAVGVINVTDRAGPRDLFKDDINYLLEFSSLLLGLVIREGLLASIKKQRAALRKKNRELEERQRMMKELSSMLIHDLKGPLSEVVANLDILSYSIADRNREFLSAAQGGCNQTVRMVENLVSVHKIEDRQFQLILETVDPAKLLREAVNGIKGMAAGRGLTLAVDEGRDTPPLLRVDRVLILRVLQNLLTNALHFAPVDSTISVSWRLISEAKLIEFRVRDLGPGLSPGREETIFNKYAMIAKASDIHVGTGLGLYFCKLVIEEHRGKIWAESGRDHGPGCSLVFQLPL